MHDESGFQLRQLDSAATLSRVERLQRDRGYRDSRRQFFIEGVRNFIAAVDNGFAFEAVVYSEKLLIQPIARKLVRRLKRAGVCFARVTPEQFRRISRAERASGVAAIVRQSVRELHELDLEKDQRWTALDHIRSRGNFGMLMRTSAAVGAAGFILIGDSIDPYDPAAIRATMGALFKQVIVRTGIEQLGRWIKSNQLEVIGASPDGTMEYRSMPHNRRVLLMLGDERRGLSIEQRRLCNSVVRIPMAEGIDSLNVAVAGSLLMYELFREMTG